MSVRQEHRTGQGRHRIAPFAEIRETVRTGPAAGFDFGFQLPPMTMAEIAAQDEPEWAVKPQQPEIAPWPGLMHALGATHAACVLADTIIDDLSDLAENVIDLLPRLESAYADHYAHLMLLPAVARLVELLGTEETGTEASR